MRSLDEINRRLAEAEQNLATLYLFSVWLQMPPHLARWCEKSHALPYMPGGLTATYGSWCSRCERIAKYDSTLNKYATLNARQAELLWQIAELQQEYVDFEVPLLAKMYARRRAGYKAIGYQIALPESKAQATQLALEKL